MSTLGPHFFQGFSLVDITATGIIRGNNIDEVKRNQQRNWETVIQCMGLRAQPQHIQEPVATEVALDHLEFGDFYSGVQTVWMWQWTVESSGVYGQDLVALHQDFEQVPIVTGLDETARFMLPIFYPYGTIKNVYFKQIHSSQAK
jgi:hypothetical protein